ncbi:MAG: SMC-Scp complex subunit ScpB [Candidatus Micrarchaeota archaeon]
MPAEEQALTLDDLSEKSASHPPLKVIEAALFLGNKFLTFAELAEIAEVKPEEAKAYVFQLRDRYSCGDAAVEVSVTQEGAVMQVKPELVGSVAQLSKRIELSGKATRILALVAKKGQLLQSDLKNYFRGEIYEYTTELKDKGYIDAKRSGNTRMLKPTQKFYDNFQLSQVQGQSTSARA